MDEVKNDLARAVVMGGDSSARGREFESIYRILEGSFFTFTCKNWSILLVFEDIENERKRGRGWPILKRKVVQHSKKWRSAKSVKENFAKSIRPWEEKSLTLLQIVKLPHSPLSKKWNDNRIGQKKNKLLRELRKLNCDLYIFPALAWCQDGVFTTNTLFTFTNDNSDSV